MIPKGGALTLALTGTPVMSGLRSVATQKLEDDLNIVNYVLTLEPLEYPFYSDGLEMFDEAAFKEDNRPGNPRENVEVIRDEEDAHFRLPDRDEFGHGGWSRRPNTTSVAAIGLDSSRW